MINAINAVCLNVIICSYGAYCHRTISILVLFNFMGKLATSVSPAPEVKLITKFTVAIILPFYDAMDLGEL